MTTRRVRNRAVVRAVLVLGAWLGACADPVVRDDDGSTPDALGGLATRPDAGGDTAGGTDAALSYDGPRPERCDLAAQTGCAPGDGCYFDRMATGRCVTVGAGRAEGERCEQFADCAPGMTCIAAPSGRPLTCHRICTVGGAPCPVDGHVCRSLPVGGVGICASGAVVVGQ